MVRSSRGMIMRRSRRARDPVEERVAGAAADHAREPLGLPFDLGPCTLVEVMGSGAGATVYLGGMTQARPYAFVGESVAVEVVHPAGPGLRERLAGLRREEIG